MNLFILSLFTDKCASLHHDVHLRKMITETAQILSTAHRVLDGVKTKTKSKTNERLPPHH